LKQNTLYALIGALVVIIVVLGAYIIHERSKPKGVELRIDQSGISVEKK
jgi:hypothetical protein